MKIRSMKPRPTNDVTCSFCKRKNTKKQIQGHPLGGRTCCDECFESNEEIQRDIKIMSGIEIKSCHWERKELIGCMEFKED